MLTNLLNALLIAVLYLSLPPQLRPDTGGKSPRHDVTALVRQLGDPHEGVRESAKLILVEIGAPAIPGLVPTLKQGNREAQSAALWVVTRIGPPAIKAAPTVADLLNDKDACVRIEAVLAIARIDPEGSVARLVKVLRCDKEEDVKEEAASELGRLGSLAKQAIPVLACEMRKGGPLGWICASALGKTGPEAARPLLDVLADPRMDWAVKREARMALGRMRPVAKETVPELVMLVRKNKSDIGTVVDLAECLKLAGPAASESVKVLSEVMAQASGRDRFLIARSIICIDRDNASAAKVLVAALSDRSVDMRQLATNAFFLHSLGKNDKTAVPALVDAVGDPDENVRLMAIGALERIGLAHQSVLKALERAKKDPKQSVRQAASGALRTLLAQPRPES